MVVRGVIRYLELGERCVSDSDEAFDGRCGNSCVIDVIRCLQEGRERFDERCARGL